jgi:hypothetical protein
MRAVAVSTRAVKALYGTSEAMATRRPAAVAMSASATPPVMAWGWLMPLSAMTPNEPIMPVTVPRSPSRGARVMIVSRTTRPRFIRSTSVCTAASIARAGAAFRSRIPAASTRAPGDREASPTRAASSHLPAPASSRTRSGSASRAVRHQNHPRSSTTERARTEQARRGTITGPPLARRATIVAIKRGLASGRPYGFATNQTLFILWPVASPGFWSLPK